MSSPAAKPTTRPFHVADSILKGTLSKRSQGMGTALSAGMQDPGVWSLEKGEGKKGRTERERKERNGEPRSREFVSSSRRAVARWATVDRSLIQQGRLYSPSRTKAGGTVRSRELRASPSSRHSSGSRGQSRGGAGWGARSRFHASARAHFTPARSHAELRGQRATCKRGKASFKLWFRCARIFSCCWTSPCRGSRAGGEPDRVPLVERLHSSLRPTPPPSRETRAFPFSEGSF